MAPDFPRAVQRYSDPQATGTGEGNTIIDDRGHRYHVVPFQGPDQTGVGTYVLYQDGTIRSRR